MTGVLFRGKSHLQLLIFIIRLMYCSWVPLHCIAFIRNALRICTALALLSLTLIISFNFDKSGIPLTHQMRVQAADVWCPVDVVMLRLFYSIITIRQGGIFQHYIANSYLPLSCEQTTANTRVENLNWNKGVLMIYYKQFNPIQRLQKRKFC